MYNWIEVIIPVLPPTIQISECYRHTGLKHPHQLLFPTRMEEWVNMQIKHQLENITCTWFQSKQWSILLASRTSKKKKSFCLNTPFPLNWKLSNP